MRIALLSAVFFLLVNLAIFANPFIGSWTADEVTVVADESTLVVTVDSENPNLTPLRGIYSYTYDAEVLRAGNFVAVYAFSPDGEQMLALCFLADGAFGMHFHRATPRFNQEMFKS